MPKTSLSDAGLRSLEPPEKGTVDWWDTALPSFGCRVSQGGAKTFILKLHNSRRAIGRYPLISLAQARTEAKRQLAEKTLGKVRPQSITYEQAVQVFLEEKGTRRRARTVKDHKRHLSLLAYKSQLADITHQDLERKLKRLPPSEFNHRLACAKTFFRWAQRKRYRPDDPTMGLSPHTVHSRARVLSDAELQLIWRACEQTGEREETPAIRKAGTPLVGANVGRSQTKDQLPRLPAHFATIVKLLILTGARRSEIASLRWSWISEDRITWPPEVMKNNRAHWLPLLSLTKSILATIPRTGDLLFPARGRDTPFNGWSKSFAHLKTLSGVDNFTLHDIRRSWASHNAAWAPPHILERALSHISGQISGVAAVYNRFQYETELTACYQQWQSWLEKHVVRLGVYGMEGR